MGDSIPITPTGRKIVEKRIADLDAQLPGVRKAIGEAREKGDLNENAEYHAAMEKMRMIEAQVNELSRRLARAQTVDPRRAPRDRVAFGAEVTVMDLGDESEETYRLVGLGEDDPERKRILTTSPVGQGLLLKKVGDEVELDLPRGTVRLRVLAIKYPD
jgi:transcription elongation factor GreA